MNIEILIISIAITTVLSLIWRNILDDNPNLLKKLQETKLIGKSFVCSFCYPQWIALIVSLLAKPISINSVFYFNNTLSAVFIDWFLISFGVLVFRPLISLLMDASAIYKHRHFDLHK